MSLKRHVQIKINGYFILFLFYILNHMICCGDCRISNKSNQAP
jgi:hypothetical protein